MTKKIKKMLACDALFCVGLIVFLSSYIWGATYYVINAELSSNVNYVRASALMFMVVAELIGDISYKKEDLFALVLIVFLVASAYISGRTFLLTQIIVIYLGRNVSISVITKCCFFTIVIWLVLLISLVWLGLLETDFVQVGTRVRGTLGFSWPSHPQNLLFAACLLIPLIARGNMRILLFLVSIIAAYAMNMISGSRSPFILTTVFCGIGLMMSILKERKEPSALFRNLWAIFPLCAICVFGVALFYNPGVPLMDDVNTLFSNRLAYSHSAVSNYSITFFGERDFGLQNEGWFASYLDSSYLSILYTYGVVAFICILVGYTGAMIAAIVKKDRFLVLSLFFVALHGVAEGWLFSIMFTPLMFLLPYGFRWKSLTLPNIEKSYPCLLPLRNRESRVFKFLINWRFRDEIVGSKVREPNV